MEGALAANGIPDPVGSPDSRRARAGLGGVGSLPRRLSAGPILAGRGGIS
jgi:hypothetical protein